MGQILDRFVGLARSEMNADANKARLTVNKNPVIDAEKLTVGSIVQVAIFEPTPNTKSWSRDLKVIGTGIMHRRANPNNPNMDLSNEDMATWMRHWRRTSEAYQYIVLEGSEVLIKFGPKGWYWFPDLTELSSGKSDSLFEIAGKWADKKLRKFTWEDEPWVPAFEGMFDATFEGESPMAANMLSRFFVSFGDEENEALIGIDEWDGADYASQGRKVTISQVIEKVWTEHKSPPAPVQKSRKSRHEPVNVGRIATYAGILLAMLLLIFGVYSCVSTLPQARPSVTVTESPAGNSQTTTEPRSTTSDPWFWLWLLSETDSSPSPSYSQPSSGGNQTTTSPSTSPNSGSGRTTTSPSSGSKSTSPSSGPSFGNSSKGFGNTSPSYTSPNSGSGRTTTSPSSGNTRSTSPSVSPSSGKSTSPSSSFGNSSKGFGNTSKPSFGSSTKGFGGKK